MWIKSQDKKSLIPIGLGGFYPFVQGVSVMADTMPFDKDGCSVVMLGNYPSSTIAEMVLMMIKIALQSRQISFEMPESMEV